MEGEQHYIISDLKQNGEKHKEIIILQLNKILLDKSMSSFIRKNCDDKMKNKGYKLLKNDNSLPLHKLEKVLKDLADNTALDPINVKPFKMTNYYEIIDGRHRFVSSIYYGYTHIPCVIYEEI